jgi:hypothetical protein
MTGNLSQGMEIIRSLAQKGKIHFQVLEPTHLENMEHIGQ